MNSTTYKHGFPVDRYAPVPFASGAPFQRDPTTADVYDTRAGGNYNIGTVWPNAATGGIWMLGQIAAGVPVWLAINNVASGNVVGPASSTANAIPRFSGTTGKIIKDSGVTVADTTNVMTFPAGAGVVYTAGGAAARKGSGTLVGGALVVNTTSAVTGGVVVPVVATLGTVTVPQALRVTIQTGVSFTVTSADATDTSVFNWAIVA